MELNASPFYFFDASAIVRLLVTEPGYQKARAIFDSTGPTFTSWIVLAEAFTVLKRKNQTGELDDKKYGAHIYVLSAYIREGRLKPVDVRTDGVDSKIETYHFDLPEIRRKYPKLDAADALQLCAIKGSFLSRFTGASTVRLVTADSGLRKAAEAEQIPTEDVSN